MAQKLWTCGDPRTWAAWHARHAEAIECRSKHKRKDQLVELQQFLAHELPKAVQARSPPHMTKEELVKLVEWKLARDKWRPSLLKYAQQQASEAVADTTGRALALLQGLPSTRPVPGTTRATLVNALQELTALKGVGPGTASAILASLAPHGVSPYMSPEAMAVAGCKPDTYTPAMYQVLLKEFHHKADALYTLAVQSGMDPADAERLCCARSLEECLYAAEVLEAGDESMAAAHGDAQTAPAADAALQAAGSKGKGVKRVTQGDKLAKASKRSKPG